MKSVRNRVGVVLVSAALAVSACSSSGGGSGVSQSQIESKLRNEPQLADMKTALKSHVKIYNTAISCIAQAIKKDANQSKLKDYVNGKASITKLGTEAQGKKAAADIKSCLKAANIPGA